MTTLLPGRTSTYDKKPMVPVGAACEVTVGAEPIAVLLGSLAVRVLAIEVYPGVRPADLASIVDRLDADLVVDVSGAYLPAAELAARIAADLTDDPLFGRLTDFSIADFFDSAALAGLREQVAQCAGRVVVVGTGASLVCAAEALVYADLARWEIQQRQRSGEIGNLAADNAGERASLLYKRAFFLDWRAADREKAVLLDRIDYFLDTTAGERPLLVAGDAVRRGLEQAAARPFRVVPFFDPAPWGGQWMREVCDLPDGPANYGWCFDCVPEENSLLLGFGDERVELPALNLVLHRPVELLGSRVVERFGAEFPIRFDFLDTIGGGNLSLQVHPLTGHIREEFGWAYTQDESYYLLDAEPGAHVYLGLREDVDPERMLADLEGAQDGGPDFPAQDHVNVVPARKHDHFLIPAGTVHCSGAGSMVLEISATPFIFTFKLWDWGRLGLDGRPRPINVERGRRAICWDRRAAYAEAELVNVVTPLAAGAGWTSERTGLHPAEPIETHRHWFEGTVPHTTDGSVNVLNLVEGAEAVVESPTGAFAPFVVHYAETFIVPAAVGDYTVRPHGAAAGRRCATLKAFVRP
ncbi:MAG: class I mannose-6-phosphate isomerase [Frankiales bacterium]|nr:class I mannose-6-phosphate isomerase [Frankiales bacterium]